MNLSNLADLEALADLPHACVANDGTECICGDAPKLTPSQKGTVRAACAALKEMDDTIRTQKREIEDLRAELDRRAQTVAELSAAADQLENGRTEIDNAAPALAEIADVATDAYEALRSLWPSPSQVGIVRVTVPGGMVSHWDLKLAGRRLQAVLCEREDAASVARGLRRVLAAIGRDATTNAAAIGHAPTEPPPAPSCVCGSSHDGEDANARAERRAGA